MNRNATCRMVALFGFIVAVMMASYGCELNKPEVDKDNQAESARKRTSYNLKYVACPHNPDNTVDIRIQKKDKQIELVDQADEYVFVCKGDKIRWVTDEDNLTFKTQFEGAATAKTNDLFESGLATIPSKDDTSANVEGRKHKQVTEAQIVGPSAIPYNDYSYALLPKDKNGKTVSTNDPHVIPM
jgi:hypothetical protein